MFNHLLVPLDGSELAEAALPMVLAIAERFGSKITLLRVVNSPYYASAGHDYTGFNAALRQEGSAYMEALQKKLLEAGFNVQVRLMEGDFIADTILDVADMLEVDAIAMSTHGRGGIRRWVFGSVADKVLQHAQIPILLVRARVEKEMPPIRLPVTESPEDIRAHSDLSELIRSDR
ncbi:MAG: universal stress protein [Chloroflexi bacterium]|nr:universal stress protein [Ardenticatenaceae bacterium]MBL1131394.1 universal stress protein [Chloroflexota bacterium]NOG37501.1 universal stress protein [Chloroflexota bacterium]GIK58277.1 MAG: universal stress protein [Chloroflexota bacterium]